MSDKNVINEEEVDFTVTIDWENWKAPVIADTTRTFSRVKMFQVPFAPSKKDHFTLPGVKQAAQDANGDWYLTDELYKFPGQRVASSKRIKYIIAEWRKNQDNEWYQSYFPFQFQAWTSPCSKCKNGVGKDGEKCQECNGKGEFPNAFEIYQMPELMSLSPDQRQRLQKSGAGGNYAYISYERQETPLLLRGFGQKREYTTYYLSNIVMYKDEAEWQAANDEYWASRNSEQQSGGDSTMEEYFQYLPQDIDWFSQEKEKPGCMREAFTTIKKSGVSDIEALKILSFKDRAEEYAGNTDFMTALAGVPF